MIKNIIFILIFILSNILQAQYRVEEISINGELTADDPYEPKFGRFDPVELYLNKGDVLSISITADFPPFIALVAPSEKFYVEYTKDGSTITNYLKNITESGTWFLSIAGDSTDFGKYHLIANYMSANSITLPRDADYCTSLKFLSEHSKTNFFFMKKAAKGGEQILWEPKINISNSLNNSIAENEKGESTYKAVMFKSENKDSSETFHKNLTAETKDCLGTDWLSNSKDWYKLASNIMTTEEIFVVKDKEISKYVTVRLVESGGAMKNYEVSLELKSKK